MIYIYIFLTTQYAVLLYGIPCDKLSELLLTYLINTGCELFLECDIDWHCWVNVPDDLVQHWVSFSYGHRLLSVIVITALP